MPAVQHDKKWRFPVERFLVMIGAKEQSNKAVGALALAARWAKQLNRTLVEPAFCSSRIVSPFDELIDPKNATTKRGVSICPKNERKHGASAIWNLNYACKHIRIISLEQWNKLIDLRRAPPFGAALRDDFYCYPGEPFKAVPVPFPPF